MNEQQKQRALQILRRFQQADPRTRQADNAAVDMAALLQELIDGQPAAAPLQPDPEPVLVVTREPDYWSGGHFYEGKRPYIAQADVWKLPIGTKLYTAPTQPDPELAEDAERYRAIRQGMVYVEPHPDGKIYVATDRGVYCKTSSEVDDIIDAAIAAEKWGQP